MSNKVFLSFSFELPQLNSDSQAVASQKIQNWIANGNISLNFKGLQPTNLDLEDCEIRIDGLTLDELEQRKADDRLQAALDLMDIRIAENHQR